jgi:hypothetical protein
MLGRKLTGSASFVCLRCRLQRAGAPKRLPFAALALPSLRAPPQRYFGSDTGRNGSDKPSRRTDRETDDDPSLEPNFEHDRDTFGHYEGATPYRRPPPSFPAPKRTYKSRGHVVSPEQEGLSVNMLGKPGSAIVLREQRAFEHRPRFPQIRDQYSAASNIDFSNILPEQSPPTDDDEILLNIHELKPVNTHVLPDNAFSGLRNTLTNGFTVAQLARYVKEYETVRQLTGEPERITETPPWVLELQSWAPIVATSAGDIEPHLRGYITKSMTPKKRLATRLIRECWDVSNQKVLDKDGYLSIRLRDVEFELLTRTLCRTRMAAFSLLTLLRR